MVFTRMNRRPVSAIVTFLGVPFALLGAFSVAFAQDLTPSGYLEAAPDLLEEGAAAYAKQCATCHGPEGKGDGEAAYLLYPKPRDFTAGNYRLVSTWERKPTDADLFKTISRGMPGSAMPSWTHLSERTRWALVHMVKALAREPWKTEAPSDPPGDGTLGTGVIAVPEEAPYSPGAREQAAAFFKEACAGCHGVAGKGDGQQQQMDIEGFATRPRDLTQGLFKGPTDPASVYRRIVIGMPGTPMPTSDWAYGENAWHLVHYVMELSSETARQAAPLEALEIDARRVRRLPEAADDPAWETQPKTVVQVMPLWWRDGRVEAVLAQAVHNGKRLSVRLSWRDSLANETVLLQGGFSDGAALQFSEEIDPPLFAMGTQESPVNIWHWKASWQRDIASGAPVLADAFPTMSRTLYPGTPKEAVYHTARAVGNPVSAARHASPVEDLNAAGIGTVTSQKTKDQNVDGQAVRTPEGWAVVFSRSFASSENGDVSLRPGGVVSMAAAVWDGEAGDRNGQKSVSIWHRLKIEK